MKKIQIIVHQNYLEDLIKNLHENGLMEIINISKEETETLENLEQATVHSDAEICANYELRLSRLIDILKKIKRKPSGLKAILKPELPEKKTVEDFSLDEIISYSEGILGEIEKKILTSEQNVKELDDKIEKINLDIGQLRYLEDFDFNISDLGKSEYLIIKAGKTSDIENLRNNLKTLDKTELYYKQFGSGKKIEWAVLLISHISEIDQLEQVCRGNITEFNLKYHEGNAKDILNTLKKEKNGLQKSKKQIISELRVYAEKNLNDLLAVREEIQLEGIRKEVARNFAKTTSSYIIKGWALERDEEKLKSSVEKVTDGCIVYNSENPSVNPDNPPTYIETPRWAQAFKGLLELFATPRYNEVNPTIIMGIFFVLFFGVMLGDAGYGLVILFLSLFGYFKFSKYSRIIGNWSFMGIWLGLTTTVVGFLTNSFFGDFIPRFFYGDPNLPLYSTNIFGIDLPLNPLKDPLTILMIALVFGLIHLNIGIILGLYQAYKRKNYKAMLTSKFCFIPLQIGGGLLIGYFILDFQLSSMLFYISGILVIIGMIMLFVAAGPVGFFDITGYVGDWLSYARLLALGLATAGMALAFNVVAELIPDLVPFVGIVLLPVILFFAHLANLGLQALGAGVHSLRLQYVEFFNRFYEGGGREFSPFKIKRRYTKVEEKID